jgi:hypothetical protein
MNTIIILEWFHIFSVYYIYTKGRDAKVVLLFDNFGVHECAVKEMNAFYLFITHSDIDEHARKSEFLSKFLHSLPSCEYYQ